MLAKSNKIELSEEFMVMWREEQTLWDVMAPSYRDKNEKGKSFRSSLRRCSLKKVLFCFKCEIFFQLTPEILLGF